MQQRRIGKLSVSAVGLGCMSMSQGYGSADRDESERALHRALDVGYTFLDTASIYGIGHNETLIGEVLGSRRDEFVLASKCGIVNRDGKRGVDCTPANVLQTLDESLQRLGMEYIDLYYLHRRDPSVPIEESVGALATAVKAGKIGYIGLSECSSTTIRKAHGEHPICAVQSEYSLWTRDPEYKVLDCCKELGIGFVPFSPLGRAFLAGVVRNIDELEEGDMRKTMPRFNDENLDHNLKLVDEFATIAKDNSCTAAQLALAWVMAQDADFVPIPGTKHVKFVEENAQAADLTISEDDLHRAGAIFANDAVWGERYHPTQMISLDPEA
ncbi:MAG: aldo/keto reductase [Gammaproteobacteria bacterium]|nr:aldo/keto reductase [Gammaproteobacteria bacterium]MDD9896308.1 aldo/keto reductase [Gammaproteobacteria bacterium]MDD9958026.1 aldo/keto reductase [Gammaproteobacteria bacterium]